MLIDIIMLIKSVYYNNEDNNSEESEVYLKGSILNKKELDNIRSFLKSNESTLKPAIEKLIKIFSFDEIKND